MSNWVESYKILGVKVGAGMADVTDSYRQLCRIHHPDVSGAPDAEEQMKKINVAYTEIREKFRREETFRERTAYTRPPKRYNSPGTQGQAQTQAQQKRQEEEQKRAEEARKKAAEELRRQRAAQYAANEANADRNARAVLEGYFEALYAYDFAKAYTFISEHDKSYITQESFVEWRTSVAKLYPMREFKIPSGSSIAMVTWDDNKTFHARKFKVVITEADFAEDKAQSGDIDKLVVHESDKWKVFLGYKSVEDLKKTFDERFESKRRRDFQKRWEEFAGGVYPEFNMLNLAGMRKTVSKEIYRHRRYGGSITFAALSIKLDNGTKLGQSELLRSAANTISNELRETDIPAYAGDGVFAIMFTELRKKSADIVIRRLVETIRKNAGSQLGSKAEINYIYEIWTESSLADISNLNNILQKLGKRV